MHLPKFYINSLKAKSKSKAKSEKAEFSSPPLLSGEGGGG